MDEHRVVSFSSMHRNKLYARSPNLQVCAAVDCHIRLEAAYVVETEAFTEKLLTKIPRRIDFASNLFLIVAPGIEPQARIQFAEIFVPANVVPMGVRNEDGCQFRKTGCVRSQRLVRNLGRIRSRTGVDADQLPPIIGNHKIVFRELEARERIYAARHDLGDAPWCKGVSRDDVFRKGSDQRNWPVETLVAAPPQIVLRLRLFAVDEGQLSEVIVDFPQPPCMRRLVGVFYAPDQLSLG